MKIHGICLVKNEADFLRFGIEANLTHFDGIYIFDNGSTDGTWEEALCLQSRHPSRVFAWKSEETPFRDSLRGQVFNAFRTRAEPETGGADWTQTKSTLIRSGNFSRLCLPDIMWCGRFPTNTTSLPKTHESGKAVRLVRLWKQWMICHGTIGSTTRRLGSSGTVIVWSGARDLGRPTWVLSITAGSGSSITNTDRPPRFKDGLTPVGSPLPKDMSTSATAWSPTGGKKSPIRLICSSKLHQNLLPPSPRVCPPISNRGNAAWPNSSFTVSRFGHDL